MRMRHKPWANDFLAENADIAISDPAQYKGRWNTVFGNDNPIHIEVGTGKGQFISGMAKQNPDINYIGIELFKSVIVTAVQKVKDSGAHNVRLLNIDAETLNDVFERGEIKRVYLNFSDPWPKNRHEKRRLTFKAFLKKYEEVMGETGEIHFITSLPRCFPSAAALRFPANAWRKKFSSGKRLPSPPANSAAATASRKSARPYSWKPGVPSRMAALSLTCTRAPAIASTPCRYRWKMSGC